MRVHTSSRTVPAIFGFISGSVTSLMTASLAATVIALCIASSVTQPRLLPAVSGTTLSALVAVSIAAPPAMLFAIHSSEIASPRIQQALRSLLQCIWVTPSIAFGLCASTVLDRWLGHCSHSVVNGNEAWLFVSDWRALLFTSIVLAVMVFPSIALMLTQMISNVPNRMREAATAVGATRWETIRFVVLPCVRRGVVGAVLLSLARAMGESVVVVLVLRGATSHGVPAGSSSATTTMAASLLTEAYSPASASNTAPDSTSRVAFVALCLLVLCVVVRALGQRLLRGTMHHDAMHEAASPSHARHPPEKSS